MHPDEERVTDGQEAPWSADAGPEPEWAEVIREGRKARGDRLREVFSTFDDDHRLTRPRRARDEGGS